MKWWSKTRHVPILLGASAVAALLGVLATGGISFPALSGVPFAEVPYFAIAPLLACAILAATSSRADSPLLGTSTRRLAPRTLALSLAPIAIAVASGPIFATGPNATWWLPARITCGDIGLQLLVGALLGIRYQALGPAVALIVAALFGRDGSSAARWAWPIDQRLDLTAWLAPAALLLLGAGATLVLSGRARTFGNHEADGER